jgi:hypothetical protein
MGRLHIFLYFIALLAIAALSQFIFDIYISSHDVNFIQSISKSYPGATNFTKHWLGVANLTGYALIGYYLNRIKSYLNISFQKKETLSQ